MNVIVYEKSRGGYEISEIIYSADSLLEIILPEPVEGIISIADITSRVERGVASFDISTLRQGVISPTLYNTEGAFKLESFVLKSKTIQRKTPDAEYIHSLSVLTGELEERLTSLEDLLLSLKEKIEKTTIF